MDQKTFSIIPLKSKDEIKQKIKQKGFRMLSERSIEATNEFTEKFHIKKEQMPVLAFALRGKDVIRTWSSILSKEAQGDIFFFHTSESPVDAEREIRLFQNSLTTHLSKKSLGTKKQPATRIVKKQVVSSEDKKTQNIRPQTKVKPSQQVAKKTATKRTQPENVLKTTPVLTGSKPIEKEEPSKPAQEPCTLVIQPEPHPSTCSSILSDENDAEVAATTGFMVSSHVQDSNRYSPVFRSESLSPSSVASRPQTPEVNELRVKFEQFIQVGYQDKLPSRPTSKMSSESIYRIKDMKPKNPAGSKVKTMVDFFMDENLNKWEF